MVSAQPPGVDGHVKADEKRGQTGVGLSDILEEALDLIQALSRKVQGILDQHLSHFFQ
jgi:hypothetical protein